MADLTLEERVKRLEAHVNYLQNWLWVVTGSVAPAFDHSAGAMALRERIKDVDQEYARVRREMGMPVD